MAITNNHIQLFRNSTVLDNREAAINKLNDFITNKNIQDGTPVLARYYDDDSVVKTLLALFYVNGTSVKYDIVGDSDDINAAIDALKSELLGGASGDYNTLKKLEDKIVKLNADATTDGSVAKAVKDAVDALNATELKADGQAIVAVSEANGVVSATTGDISAEHVIQDAATEGDPGTPAVTVKTAIDNLRTTVATDDKTSVKVNVDAQEKVLSANGALKTTIQLVEITDGLDANTAKAYQLQGIDNAPLGDLIKIPKDSSLKTVYLGTATDSVDAEGNVTSASTGDFQSLNFVYHLEDGTYRLVPVDVSKFLTESEFEDGLEVAPDGVVKVKVDTNSENFLSVGADGVKLSGVQAAIDAAKTSATTVVDAAAHTHITVTATTEADGHTKYTVSDNVNGGNVNLDDYVNTVSGNPAATDTVNDAISKLFNLITAGGTNATAIKNELDTAENAIGLTENGTHITTNGNYTSGATTIAGEIAALDTQVKANADAIATNKVVAGDGITAVEATGAGTTVSAKINAASGLAINADKAIEISSIDAGTY